MLQHKEFAVFGEAVGHIILAEECAQYGFLLEGGLASPVFVQQLFNVLIVHNSLFLNIFVLLFALP